MCLGPIHPTQGPPQPRREDLLLASPQLHVSSLTHPDPMWTPEMGWAWHPKSCLGPLMANGTSMGLAATSGPVSLAATLNLSLFFNETGTAIPTFRGFNKDNM